MRRERKNIRLGNFDYSSEYSHYVTICTEGRQWFFGKTKNGKMEYSPVGEIARIFWAKIPDHFPHVILDEFVIMPNHIHGIIKLDYSTMCKSNGETSPGTCHGNLNWNMPWHVQLSNSRQIQFNKFGRPVSGSVSMIINHFKSAVKRWCNKNGYYNFLWQPRFYDHIINNQEDLMRIRKYIILNPAKWDCNQKLNK